MTMSFRLARLAILAIFAFSVLVTVEGIVPGSDLPAGNGIALTLRDGLRTLFGVAIAAFLLRLVWIDSRQEEVERPVEALSAGKIVLSLATLLLAAFFVWLFLSQPQVFHILGQPDNIVGVGSGLVMLLAALLFLRTRSLLKRAALDGLSADAAPAADACALAAAILTAAAVLLLQPVLQASLWGLPSEAALFSTRFGIVVDHLLAGLAFVAVVVIPLLVMLYRPRLRQDHPGSFLPSILPMVIVAPAFAFNGAAWALLPVQVLTIMTVAMLLIAAALAQKVDRWREFLLIALAAVAVVAIQQVFLLRLADMTDPTDSEHYKPVFIALAALAYAHQTTQRLRANTRRWV